MVTAKKIPIFHSFHQRGVVFHQRTNHQPFLRWISLGDAETELLYSLWFNCLDGCQRAGPHPVSEGGALLQGISLTADIYSRRWPRSIPGQWVGVQGALLPLQRRCWWWWNVTVTHAPHSIFFFREGWILGGGQNSADAKSRRASPGLSSSSCCNHHLNSQSLCLFSFLPSPAVSEAFQRTAICSQVSL